MSSRALPPTLALLAACCLLAAWLTRAAPTPPPRGTAVAPQARASAPPAPLEPGRAQPPPPTKPTPPVCLPVPVRYRGQVISKRTKGFPQRLLALTFDDGPSETVTPRILAALREHGARATFFCLGSAIDGHEELVAQAYSEGHAIGNHSYSHPSSTTSQTADSELRRTAELIERSTGHAPDLFRPPYGITKGNLNRAALSQGYAGILWTISSADTDSRATVDTIANNVIHTPNPGDIVLMHDSGGHQETAEALPRILEELGAAGFSFVTVPELLTAWDRWLAERETTGAAAPEESGADAASAGGSPGAGD